MKLITSSRGRCAEVRDEPMAVSFPSARTGTPRKGCERRIIKVGGLQLALQLAIAIVVFAATAGGAATKALAFSRHELEAKIAYCQDCHGPAGQGFLGFYPIPRLAGQPVEYFENQLRAFADRQRANTIMRPVARSLSPAMMTALATDFHAMNPRPLGGARRGLAAMGEKIFQDGVPEENVPACAACHGPEATGFELIARLAGQPYPYILKTLADFRSKDRKEHLSDVMYPVVESLNKQQIEAVAAYLSNLR
jgi:cytochrome c553